MPRHTLSPGRTRTLAHSHSHTHSVPRMRARSAHATHTHTHTDHTHTHGSQKVVGIVPLSRQFSRLSSHASSLYQNSSTCVGVVVCVCLCERGVCSHSGLYACSYFFNYAERKMERARDPVFLAVGHDGLCVRTLSHRVVTHQEKSGGKVAATSCLSRRFLTHTHTHTHTCSRRTHTHTHTRHTHDSNASATLIHTSCHDAHTHTSAHVTHTHLSHSLV